MLVVVGMVVVTGGAVDVDVMGARRGGCACVEGKVPLPAPVFCTAAATVAAVSVLPALVMDFLFPLAPPTPTAFEERAEGTD